LISFLYKPKQNRHKEHHIVALWERDQFKSYVEYVNIVVKMI